MKLLASCTLLLTVSAVSAFNLRGTGNDTLQQQEKEADVYSRIFNGQLAKHFDFPYQVGLLKHVTNTDQRMCGGSLISEEWVLTAAHCVHGGSSVSVLLGSIQFTRPKYNYRIYREDIIEHEDFNSTTLVNDIAVIRISEVMLSKTVHFIRLPPFSRSTQSYVDTKTVLAGWGDTSNTPTNNEYLHYAEFIVISNKRCADIYGNVKVYKGKLCTTSRDRSSGCTGDSGGPLVFFHNKEPIQIGIQSFIHRDGCEAGYPNGFTRVESYLRWITEKTGVIG